VPVPWQGWSMRRDDFLLTRMLEVVVHADDLALSVAVRTPEFPAEVFAPVRDLLVRLAVKRQGQSAVISAPTRSECTQAILPSKLGWPLGIALRTPAGQQCPPAMTSARRSARRC
jgi:hypothetical protein